MVKSEYIQESQQRYLLDSACPYHNLGYRSTGRSGTQRCRCRRPDMGLYSSSHSGESKISCISTLLHQHSRESCIYGSASVMARICVFFCLHLLLAVCPLLCQQILSPALSVHSPFSVCAFQYRTSPTIQAATSAFRLRGSRSQMPYRSRISSGS